MSLLQRIERLEQHALQSGGLASEVMHDCLAVIRESDVIADLAYAQSELASTGRLFSVPAKSREGQATIDRLGLESLPATEAGQAEGMQRLQQELHYQTRRCLESRLGAAIAAKFLAI